MRRTLKAVLVTDNTTKAGAVAAMQRVLMADYNVTLEQLTGPGITITTVADLPGRRSYPIPEHPLFMASLGNGVVISTTEERREPLESLVRNRTRDDLFTMPVFGQIDALLSEQRQFLAGPSPRFLGARDRFRPAAAPAGVTIELLREEQVHSLYQFPGFTNALAYDGRHPRRDSLATVAWRGSELLGIAGANTDAPELWQIGVDVVENARGTGVGVAIVSRLVEAIFDEGVVPFYSTSVPNIASQSVAHRLGFWPAWTESYAASVERLRR